MPAGSHLAVWAGQVLATTRRAGRAESLPCHPGVHPRRSTLEPLSDPHRAASGTPSAEMPLARGSWITGASETLAAASRRSSPEAGTSPRATRRRKRRIAGKQPPRCPGQGRGSRAQPHRPADRPRCVLRPPGHRRHLPCPAPSRHGPGFLLGHFLAQAGGGTDRAGRESGGSCGSATACERRGTAG